MPVPVACHAGSTPKSNGRAKCRGDEKGQDQRIDGETHVEPRIGLRQHPHERAMKDGRHRDGGGAADCGQRETFGDELGPRRPRLAPSARRKRDLRVGAPRRAQQQVGQVRARDQQQHRRPPRAAPSAIARIAGRFDDAPPRARPELQALIEQHAPRSSTLRVP
jgi:hypothetical protein